MFINLYRIFATIIFVIFLTNCNKDLKKSEYSKLINSKYPILAEKVIVNKTGIGELKYGSDFNHFRINNPQYEYYRQSEFSTIISYKNKKLLEVVYSENYFIEKFWVFSDNYELYNGIKIGMNISDILPLIKNKLMYCELYEESIVEQFDIVEPLNDNKVFRISVLLTSLNNKLLGEYDSDSIGASTSKYSLNGIVESMFIRIEND